MMMKRKMNSVNKVMNSTFWDLPTSSSMSYFWNFGSTLGIICAIQIISGFFLTMSYSPTQSDSFLSIVLIMKEVWMGWMLRLLHLNGASMLFLFIYLHLFRGVFFMSSSNKVLWASGITIMGMMMMISFLGYVLPWGQMSYWAVAVITNLLSIIPMIGDELIKWIWGGFSVGKATLSRFYSLHFITPMILLAIILTHLALLHNKGSSNSLGVNSNLEKMEFHPYYTIKDMAFLINYALIFMFINMIWPFFSMDPVNNVPANPMQTPLHIQPEWYFLSFYAILRAMPSKSMGVISLVMGVLIFMILPVFKFKTSTKFQYKRYFIFWMLVTSFLSLMKMGAMPAEEPYILTSKIWSMLYFSSVILLNS